LDKIDLNPKSEFQLYYSDVQVNWGYDPQGKKKSSLLKALKIIVSQPSPLLTLASFDNNFSAFYSNFKFYRTHDTMVSCELWREKEMSDLNVMIIDTMYVMLRH
jgi:hypothetical protein